jgi:hypothetical protein
MERKKDPAFKRSDESYEKNRIYMQEYNKTEKARTQRKQYADKVTPVIIRLNPEKDADILEALDPSRPAATQLKEFIRLALKARNMFQ